MSLYLRGRIWWSRIVLDAKRRDRSTRCNTREEAEKVEKDWTNYASDPAVRFWNQVNKQGPVPSTVACTKFPEIAGTSCWFWTRSTTRNGYGKTFFEGRQVTAHRVSWFLTHGSWPEECACHKCDNPPCCNPDHLFDADQSANVVDMYEKKELSKTLLKAA